MTKRNNTQSIYSEIRKWHQIFNKGYETILENLQWLLWGNVHPEWFFCGYLRGYEKTQLKYSLGLLMRTENETKRFVDRESEEKAFQRHLSSPVHCEASLSGKHIQHHPQEQGTLGLVTQQDSDSHKSTKAEQPTDGRKPRGEKTLIWSLIWSQHWMETTCDVCFY